jgi:hypothetical protein
VICLTHVWLSCITTLDLCFTLSRLNVRQYWRTNARRGLTDPLVRQSRLVPSFLQRPLLIRRLFNILNATAALAIIDRPIRISLQFAITGCLLTLSIRVHLDQTNAEKSLWLVQNFQRKIRGKKRIKQHLYYSLHLLFPTFTLRISINAYHFL